MDFESFVKSLGFAEFLVVGDVCSSAPFYFIGGRECGHGWDGGDGELDACIFEGVTAHEALE